MRLLGTVANIVALDSLQNYIVSPQADLEPQDDSGNYSQFSLNPKPLNSSPVLGFSSGLPVVRQDSA